MQLTKEMFKEKLTKDPVWFKNTVIALGNKVSGKVDENGLKNEPEFPMESNESFNIQSSTIFLTVGKGDLPQAGIDENLKLLLRDDVIDYLFEEMRLKYPDLNPPKKRRSAKTTATK